MQIDFQKSSQIFLSYLWGVETCYTLLIDCINRTWVYWMKSLDFSDVRVLTEPFHLNLSQSNHSNNFHCANVPYPSWYCVWESLWLSRNNLLTPIKCRFFLLQLCSSHKCSPGPYANPNYHRSIQPLKLLLCQRGAQSMMSHLHLAALPFSATCFLERIQRIEGGRVGATGRGVTYLSIPASGSFCLEGGPQTILGWAHGGNQGLGWPPEWRS